MPPIAIRLLILALLGTIGSACSSSPQKSDDGTAEVPVRSCAEPRPEACTMEFIPVCGHLYNGELKTYDNACNACADPAVSGRQPGPCP
jgi:hypothetical protein